MAAPSIKEEHISQLPALKLLINVGRKYLSLELSYKKDKLFS